jgi:uncharacterized protein
MAEVQKTNEKTWAMSSHLSALAGFIIPFGNIIGPLVVWLLKKKESALVEKEAKKALNFQISVTIYAIIAFILTFIFIGVILLPAVAMFNIAMIIVATVKTNNGEDFKYPLSLNFIK